MRKLVLLTVGITLLIVATGCYTVIVDTKEQCLPLMERLEKIEHTTEYTIYKGRNALGHGSIICKVPKK